MNDHITIGGAAVTSSLVLGTALIRWAVTPVRTARHRNPGLLPSEEVLIGPPSTYTDPFADTQPFGVVRTGFGWCQPCQQTTAGVITRNGFRCGEGHHPAGGTQ